MTRHLRLTFASAACLTLLVGGALGGCTGEGDQDRDATPTQSSPGEPLASADAEGYPLGYPKDEIPLIEGDITSTEIGGKKNPGYSFALLTDKPPAEALTEAVGLLIGAGWTSRTEVDAQSPEPQILSRGKDLIIVTGVESDDRTVVSYAIQLS